VEPRVAHLGLSGEYEEMQERFKNIFSDINLNNKIILDYGCGGALLGDYLFNNFRIKKYIAYDVAERSIKIANERLKNFENKELNLVKEHTWKFKDKKPNIIVCLACMIHFPTQTYLNNFLSECNNSDASYLILEIRNKNIGTKFQVKPYKDRPSVLQACITTSEYVSNKLTNYKLIYEQNNNLTKTNCQILKYKINKKHE
jgi:SAM-dependent methyltransferase